MKTIAIFAFILATGVTAFGAQICTGYDANGNCTGYVNTEGGGYSPNIPGYPTNPASPSRAGQCICGGHNAQGACTVYVGSGC